MKPRIVVLMFGHKAQRGKDESCKHLVNAFDFKRFAFADKLKNVVADLYDFSHEQMHGDLKDVIDVRYGITPRQVLQEFGGEQRKRYPKIWAEYVFREIDQEVFVWDGVPNETFTFCVSDFRFHNEFDVAFNWSLDTTKYDKSLYAVKMERPGVVGVTGTGDVSENDLNNFTKWNFVVNNDGTIEDLQWKITNIWQSVKK
jgi:hypothetical protein